MSNSRFVLNLQAGASTEETTHRLLSELIRLTDLLNNAKIPIVVGPGETLPEGMLQGQPVIVWNATSSQTLIWNGKDLV